jgi:hypothetical protein
MSRHCLLVVTLLLCPLLCLLVGPAWAGDAAADAAGKVAYPVADAFKAMDAFNDAIYTKINSALRSGAVSEVVNVLFMALAISLFVWKFVGYALRGFDVMDIVELMLTIVFVYILLKGYSKIFPVFIGGMQHVGDQLGIGIAGTPPDGSLARSMMSKFADYFFKPACEGLDCFGSKVGAMIAAFVAMVAVLLLGIAAMLVELWCTWGFAIAYAIGWVTIPFLLYERLQFMFDGWLKFFFGMGVYAIVAKVNLALVYLSIELFTGGKRSGMSATAPKLVEGFSDIAGLLVFVFVGIFSLMSTNRFAQSIVMGAGGGGIGGMVQATARAGAQAASGGAGAAAGAIKR